MAAERIQGAGRQTFAKRWIRKAKALMPSRNSDETIVASHVPSLPPENKPQRKIRCAVVGNSNSIADRGYVHHLAARHDIEITNFSIGASPNGLLMHFLSIVGDLDFDYIIAETSVMDDDMARTGNFSKDEAIFNAHHFASTISRSSKAKVIWLIIPTQHGVLYPNTRWVDDLYIKTAIDYGAFVLNGYSLFKSLSGPAWQRLSSDLLLKMEALLAEFGISKTLTYILAFQPILMSKLGFGLAARHFFHDKLHVSYSIHILIAEILGRWMENNADQVSYECSNIQDRSLIAVTPDGAGQTVLRTSSLLTRSMAMVSPESPVRYDAPSGHRAAALLLNMSATCGVLWIESATARTEIDMRFSPSPREFTAVVAPIPEDIGDGPFTVGVRSGDGVPIAGRRYWYVMPTRLDARAEVAEIALVRRHMDLSFDRTSRSENDVAIENEPWVFACIRDHAARFEALDLSGELSSVLLPRPFFDLGINFLASDVARPPEALQAFFAVIAGDLARATALLTKPARGVDSDATLRQLLAAIADVEAALR